jgi:pimeloyl-ACP methyl ester carboxylesterase
VITRRFKVLSLAATFAIVIYFLIPVILLRFALDRFIFLQVDGGPTHEDRRIDVSLPGNRSIVIRQYGNSRLPRCAIFFPGQHGGISVYEEILFPDVRDLGAAVYALSYPGQEGAKGYSRRVTLIDDIDAAMTAITNETSCQPRSAVFIGRSLGSAIAIFAAQRTRPKGLLLDGVSPTLSTAIHAAVGRHMVTQPWSLLPLPSIVENDFPLAPVIHSLRPTPVVIFQGTDDRVTPFAEAQKALVGLDNLEFLAVPHAIHDNAYRVANLQYSKKLEELFAR